MLNIEEQNLTEFLLDVKVNFITINNYDYDYTVNNFSKNCIKVNGVGVNISKNNFTRNNSKYFNIGVIAAYRKNKGYNDLIYIAENLKNNPNIKFHCYGYDSKLKYQYLL